MNKTFHSLYLVRIKSIFFKLKFPVVYTVEWEEVLRVRMVRILALLHISCMALGGLFPLISEWE